MLKLYLNKNPILMSGGSNLRVFTGDEPSSGNTLVEIIEDRPLAVIPLFYDDYTNVTLQSLQEGRDGPFIRKDPIEFTIVNQNIITPDPGLSELVSQRYRQLSPNDEIYQITVGFGFLNGELVVITRAAENQVYVRPINELGQQIAEDTLTIIKFLRNLTEEEMQLVQSQRAATAMPVAAAGESYRESELIPALSSQSSSPRDFYVAEAQTVIDRPGRTFQSTQDGDVLVVTPFERNEEVFSVQMRSVAHLADCVPGSLLDLGYINQNDYKLYATLSSHGRGLSRDMWIPLLAKYQGGDTAVLQSDNQYIRDSPAALQQIFSGIKMGFLQPAVIETYGTDINHMVIIGKVTQIKDCAGRIINQDPEGIPILIDSQRTGDEPHLQHFAFNIGYDQINRYLERFWGQASPFGGRTTRIEKIATFSAQNSLSNLFQSMAINEEEFQQNAAAAGVPGGFGHFAVSPMSQRAWPTHDLLFNPPAI